MCDDEARSYRSEGRLMLSSVMSRPDGLMGQKRFAQSVSCFGLQHRTHEADRANRVGLSNRPQLSACEWIGFRATYSPLACSSSAATFLASWSHTPLFDTLTRLKNTSSKLRQRAKISSISADCGSTTLQSLDKQGLSVILDRLLRYAERRHMIARKKIRLSP